MRIRSPKNGVFSPFPKASTQLFQHGSVPALLLDLIEGLVRLAVEIRKRGWAVSERAANAQGHGQRLFTRTAIKQPDAQGIQPFTHDFA